MFELLVFDVIVELDPKFNGPEVVLEVVAVLRKSKRRQKNWSKICWLIFLKSVKLKKTRISNTSFAWSNVLSVKLVKKNCWSLVTQVKSCYSFETNVICRCFTVGAFITSHKYCFSDSFFNYSTYKCNIHFYFFDSDCTFLRVFTSETVLATTNTLRLCTEV